MKGKGTYIFEQSRPGRGLGGLLTTEVAAAMDGRRDGRQAAVVVRWETRGATASSRSTRRPVLEEGGTT